METHTYTYQYVQVHVYVYNCQSIHLSIIYLSIFFLLSGYLFLSMFEFTPTPLTSIEHPRSYILSLYYAAFFPNALLSHLQSLSLTMIKLFSINPKIFMYCLNSLICLNQASYLWLMAPPLILVAHVVFSMAPLFLLSLVSTSKEREEKVNYNKGKIGMEKQGNISKYYMPKIFLNYLFF